jgi:hypothetical protein
MTALVAISAPLAGRLTDLIGPRWPITIGMTLLALGLLVFSRLGANASFLNLLPGMVIGGVGMGVAMGPMTTAALSAVTVDGAGVASGVLTTSRQVGGALGIAVTGAIVAAAETVSPTNPRYPLPSVDGFQHALQTGAVIRTPDPRGRESEESRTLECSGWPAENRLGAATDVDTGTPAARPRLNDPGHSAGNLVRDSRPGSRRPRSAPACAPPA